MDPQLVEALKVDMLAELYTALFYFTCAHNIQGTDYLVYHKFFKDEFYEEMTHMNKLAKRIHGAGVPVELPSVTVPQLTSITEMLEQSLTLEESAIHSYSSHAELAEKLGDVALETFFQDQVVAEDLHKKKLLILLNKTDI